MSTPVIAFFNSKSNVGKTSLAYHLTWMFTEIGWRIIVADLDPQANLTSTFLDEDRLEVLWPDGNHPDTIFGCMQPLIQGTGEIAEPHLEEIDDTFQPTLLGSSLALLVGDLFLSRFEDELSDAWSRCLEDNPRAFRITSAFAHIMQRAATIHNAHIVLMDLGPNLSAINRAALTAADYVIMPLSTDLFSLQGLYNSGPALRHWRIEWQKRLARNTTVDLALSPTHMQPLGYVVLQHALRMDRPIKAYGRWMARIPKDYREYVLGEHDSESISASHDPERLALLKHYHNLMSLAQEAHKPMFSLKPADGAIGAHIQAVQGVYKDFNKLAHTIAERAHIALP